jgi:ribonuclease inhibitor
MGLIIDGSKIMSEEDFHVAIAEGLDLPNWYGKSLDALWDALTGMVGRPLKITWKDAKQSRKIFPKFEQIISLFRDVEEQDKKFMRDEIFKFEIG